MLAVERYLSGMKLPINKRKTRCLRCPDDAFELLEYLIGRNYRYRRKGSYIGSLARQGGRSEQISGLTEKRSVGRPTEAVVVDLNRAITGWTKYFSLGQISPVYRTVNYHAEMRLRRWLCLKHRVKTGEYVCFPDRRLHCDMGLLLLTRMDLGLPRAMA